MLWQFLKRAVEEIAICLIFFVPKSAGGWQLCARDLLRAGALGRRLHVELHIQHQPRNIYFNEPSNLQQAPDAPVLERSILTVPKALLSSTKGCQRERQAHRVSERCVPLSGCATWAFGPSLSKNRLAFLLALKMQRHSIDAKVLIGGISMYFVLQPGQIKQWTQLSDLKRMTEVVPSSG